VSPRLGEFIVHFSHIEAMKLIWRQPANDHKWCACFDRGVQHSVLELVEWLIWRAHKVQIARGGVQHIGQATANHDQCWLGPAARRQAG
jgi:hypothetical protein